MTTPYKEDVLIEKWIPGPNPNDDLELQNVVATIWYDQESGMLEIEPKEGPQYSIPLSRIFKLLGRS